MTQRKQTPQREEAFHHVMAGYLTGSRSPSQHPAVVTWSWADAKQSKISRCMTTGAECSEQSISCEHRRKLGVSTLVMLAGRQTLHHITGLDSPHHQARKYRQQNLRLHFDYVFRQGIYPGADFPSAPNDIASVSQPGLLDNHT